jgi:hypothetical protein
MMIKSRFACIATGPDTYLDHLGVICYIMGIPLFVTEELTYQSALTFYPQVETYLVSLEELDASFLAQHFDAIFESGKFIAANLDKMIQLLYQKKMRFIYSPHGHSDKGHSAKKTINQDISLVYGQHMIDLLTQTGAIQKIRHVIRTGNYRLPFYRKHQAFYDELMKKKIGSSLNLSKKTILYAPSWQDGENPTSFFKSTSRLIDELSESYNLIIKLHPFLAEFHPSETTAIVERYQNRLGALFLTEFPCIYPLLNISDLYIGDYSSIGYDFLAFDKPLYFLLEEESPSFAIHSCGLSIPKAEKISHFLERTLEENKESKAKARKTVYEYAFGRERNFAELKLEIEEALFKEKELL